MAHYGPVLPEAGKGCIAEQKQAGGQLGHGQGRNGSTNRQQATYAGSRVMTKCHSVGGKKVEFALFEITSRSSITILAILIYICFVIFYTVQRLPRKHRTNCINTSISLWNAL
jgi:hypothetical protein